MLDRDFFYLEMHLNAFDDINKKSFSACSVAYFIAIVWLKTSFCAPKSVLS